MTHPSSGHFLRAHREFLLLTLVLSACVQSKSPAERLADPVGTMLFLQEAIRDEDWDAAQNCFSSEIRTANANAIRTRAFYLTDYWTSTTTLQTFFGPMPIIDRRARFSLRSVSKDHHLAEVQITYPDSQDKDMRLHRISLVKEPDGAWRVADIYGVTRGVAASEAGR